ncbi:hypothetical protein DV736_g4674, partial [Chaetothyriales sp. CBS 134916]
MPSVAAYTPYETLKLCQLAAQQGTDALAFQETAIALNANPLIREGDSYDASRLTADALHGLYDDLVKQETGSGSPKVNGDGPAEPANLRKRKLLASPLPNGEHDVPEEEESLQALVAKLYTRFREEAIKAIKRDEDEYARLQKEIDELEQHVDAAPPAPPGEPQKRSPTASPHKRQGSKTDISALLTHDDDSAPRPRPGHQVPIHAPGVHVQHMPPPMEHLTQNRASATSTPTHNSPVLPQHQYPQPYPGYPPYQQPPPHWPPQDIILAQAADLVVHTNPRLHKLLIHPTLRLLHYAYTGPITPPAKTQPIQLIHSLEAATPAFSDSESDRRPRHDSAPPRATDPDQPIRTTRSRGRPQSMTPSASAAVKRRSQSAVSHRSDTPTEGDSTIKRCPQRIKTEAPSTPGPDSLAVDLVEPAARSTGRTRGRLRNNDLSSTPSAPATSARSEVTRTGTVKRKQPSTDQESPSPAVRSPMPTNQSTMHAYPRFLVLVSKNFAKTSQLVLNEIQSHKLAGIFAKPLTQREAPGYKDLIFRPMDLKTLRAAVTKGSRAAIAAIEGLEEKRDAEDKNVQANTQHDGHHERGKEKEIGNGFWLVRQTDDLVPPKGIVNAAQLEMELARMFANAVMFNPLPSSERGFGKALRLRRFGGEDYLHTSRTPRARASGSDESDQDGDEESDTSESEGDGMEGIIADTREMFEDTMNKVSEWRRVEAETMDTIERTANESSQIPSDSAARSTSVDANLHRENDASTAPAPAPEVEASVERRKRRRVGD